jgi:hypothetical protein
MNRREFLGTLAAAPLAIGAQSLTGTRIFDIMTRIELPGATGKSLPFLMYPQAEVEGVRRDSLDPASFKYTITARQV